MPLRLRDKHVIFLVANEFEDIELLFPLMRLREEGARVTVATLPKQADGHFSPRPYDPDKPITGRFGTTVPFFVLEEGLNWHHREIGEDLDASDFDAVIVPGGLSPDFLRHDRATLDFVAAMHRAGRVVAAICHGPHVLVSADARCGTDLVRGRKVTGFEACRDDLANGGGELVDAGTVVDGNVVTGRVPDDLADFCRAIIDSLTGNAADGVYHRG